MIDLFSQTLSANRAGVIGALMIAAALGGCATGGINSSVFVDPSRYDLYNCEQLVTARVDADKKATELQALIAKAETGVAGPLVSGLAYNVDYSAAVAQRDLIDQKYATNNCAAELRSAPPSPPPPVAPRGRTKR